MSGNVGLNLYDQDKFRKNGDQILKNCKAIVDKATAPKIADNLPIVQGKNPEEKETAGLDIVKINNRERVSSKSLAESSNTADNIYDDIKGMRAELERNESISDDKFDEVDDAVKYISEQEDDNSNEKMMFFHKDYQKKYGDKYVHGSATSDNYFQREFTTDVQGFSSNNNANIIIGKEKSATLIDATFEFERTSALVSNSSDDTNTKADDKHDNDNNIQAARKHILTRTETDEDYPDPEDPPEPPQPKEMTNNKSIDISVLHNREINIGEKEFSVGAGVEYHNHNNNNNEQLTFRGGFADTSSGFGIVVNTTRFSSVGDDGQRHHIRDTKVKAVILNNTIDKYPMEEAQKSNEEDLSDLPIVKTENKFGLNLNTENENLGGTASYVIRDVSSFENNTYKRSQAYLKAGYLNEPQGVDIHDKHKIKLNAIYNYQNIKTNGNYFKANINGTYHTTVQTGSTPDYLIGVSASADTKKGPSQITAQGSCVKTQNTKFLTLTASYKYSKNNFEFGVNAGYYNMNYFDDPMDYISVGINAAYKF